MSRHPLPPRNNYNSHHHSNCLRYHILRNDPLRRICYSYSTPRPRPLPLRTLPPPGRSSPLLPLGVSGGGASNWTIVVRHPASACRASESDPDDRTRRGETRFPYATARSLAATFECPTVLWGDDGERWLISCCWYWDCPSLFSPLSTSALMFIVRSLSSSFS